MMMCLFQQVLGCDSFGGGARQAWSGQPCHVARVKRVMTPLGASRIARIADIYPKFNSLQVKKPGRCCVVLASVDEEGAGVQQEYCVVNFYHLVDIEDPQEVVQRHRKYLDDKEVRGRIYVSEQGMNAQYGGITEDAVGYAEWLISNEPNFENLNYSVDPVVTHMFPKLRLQYKPNLISLAGGMASIPVTREEARATKVPPSQWKAMLDSGIDGKKPLVLDVRNAYEWDAGHFEGAERPSEHNFHETPTDSTDDQVIEPLHGVDTETPVMMYCTGGIRCDVYSTYLKRKGYKNLYTLEGGIQNYMKTEGLDHWNGSLYVFDGRMAIRPNKDRNEPLEPVVGCSICGGKAILPHLNCANVDCNKLFLACQECQVRQCYDLCFFLRFLSDKQTSPRDLWMQDTMRGCCCELCMDAPRLLRPIKPEGAYGQYGKMFTYKEG